MTRWQRWIVVVGVTFGAVALAANAFLAGAVSSPEAVDVTERSEPTP